MEGKEEALCEVKSLLWGLGTSHCVVVSCSLGKDGKSASQDLVTWRIGGDVSKSPMPKQFTF